MSQDRYEKETRREIEKAVAARLKAKPTRAAAAGAKAVPNISSTITTNTSTTNPSSTRTSSNNNATKHISATASIASDAQDITNKTDTATANTTTTMEHCITKMGSCELGAGADSSVLTTTGRPQRR